MNGNGISTTALSPTPVPQVQFALQELDQVSNRLMAHMVDLEARLGPVLASDVEVAPDKSDRKESSTPIASCILASSYQINGVCEHIVSLLRRLEV